MSSLNQTLPLSKSKLQDRFPLSTSRSISWNRKWKNSWCGKPLKIYNIITSKFGEFSPPISGDIRDGLLILVWHWSIFLLVRSYQFRAILHAVSLSIHLFPPKAVHQKPSKVEHETFICNSENLKQKTNPKSDSSSEHYAVPPDIRISKNNKRT